MNTTSVKVLQAVEHHAHTPGNRPGATVTMIMVMTNLSETTIREHLKLLLDGGFVRRERAFKAADRYHPTIKQEEPQMPTSVRRPRRSKQAVAERDERVLKLLGTGQYTRAMVATLLDLDQTDAYWALRGLLLRGQATKVRDGSRTPLWVAAESS